MRENGCCRNRETVYCIGKTCCKFVLDGENKGEIGL